MGPSLARRDQIPVTDATLVFDAAAILGEGCFWHPSESRLYWVDIEGCRLHSFDPASGVNRSFDLPARIGCAVPVESGGLLVALQNGIHFFDPETQRLDFLTNPLQGKTDIRFNDGKADDAGRFWVGSMHLRIVPGVAALYRLDRSGSVVQVLDGVTISNGMAWTEDQKTLYYIDTPKRTVDAFEFSAADGTIHNRRVVFSFQESEGQPDGMTIDLDGKLWVAMWSGGQVLRLDPDTGICMERVRVPAPLVTSCCFGGEDLRTLYITTARVELNDAQRAAYPHSGGLFALKTKTSGKAAACYRGKTTMYT